MDAFKATEIARMDQGGNEAWRGFWEEKEKGKRWEDVELEVRYGGEVGEEWKERLGCKAEDREYKGMPPRGGVVKKTVDGTGAGTASPQRTGSPAAGIGGIASQKERNEAYFAKMGSKNAHRPPDLPPSQGGKYSGFGSQAPLDTAEKGTDGLGIPGVDEFQKDPVAALTKGFGWFTTTVGKGAKTMNEGWIQPTAQKVRLCLFTPQYNL